MKRQTNLLVRAAMTLLLAVLCSSGAWAQDAKIIVWLNDGSKTEVLFADMPEFTYVDGNITSRTVPRRRYHGPSRPCRS